MQNIDVFLLGRTHYAGVLSLMNELHDLVAKGERTPVVLVTEHEAVVTMGNRKLHGDLKFSLQGSAENFLSLPQIPYFEIDRGGSATAHEPGQLVVYPIVPIQWFGASVRSYISTLEKAVIDTCKQFGVAAEIKKEFPGVWVGERKIAAVGVRVKNHVTKHGLAFNVTNNFSAFENIVPCGIRGKSISSLFAEIENPEHTVAEQQGNQLGQWSRVKLFAAAQSALLQNLEQFFVKSSQHHKLSFELRQGAAGLEIQAPLFKSSAETAF